MTEKKFSGSAHDVLMSALNEWLRDLFTAVRMQTALLSGDALTAALAEARELKDRLERARLPLNLHKGGKLSSKYLPAYRQALERKLRLDELSDTVSPEGFQRLARELGR